MKRYKIAARREIALKAIAVGLSAIVSIGIGFAAAQNKDSRESQPLMHIHNLYADANRETHFRDIKIEPRHRGTRWQGFRALSCYRHCLSDDGGQLYL